MIGPLVDGLIIALMLAVMALGVCIHVRLRALQAGLPEAERAVLRLGELAGQAQAATGELKAVAIEVEARFANQMAAAQKLADELRLLSDRADHASERLSDRIRAARDRHPANPSVPLAPSSSAAAPPGREAAATRGEIERALSRLR